ncbi:MAG: hypothetical protein AMS25_01465 [Gemmatimonas sp. SM23_52]|nr:MAG: hypothetical protein AMS25_01465 [Gemmatimonas sp. SM23_52]
MRVIKRVPGLIAILLLLATRDAAGQAAQLDSLRLTHDQAGRRVAAVAAARQEAGAWAEEHYRRISGARAEGGRELREALRAAQNAADSLAALDVRLAEALAAEHEARRAFAAALESDLQSTLRQAEAAAPFEKAALSERARGLAAELAVVQEPLRVPLAWVPDVAIELRDGPQEITLKADFLADRAGQLRSAAEVVTAEMDKARRRLGLQEEMDHLLAEVRLFDDAGVPPTATGEPGQGAEYGRELCCDVLDPNQTGPADAPVATAGELNLPMLGEQGGVAVPVQPESVVDRLARLRENLLRRAEVLERRSEEFRSLLQNRP